MVGLSETIDVLKGSVGAHHEPTSSSQNVKRGSSKCSAVPLASPTLRGYSSSMAAVYDRDPRWECAELKGCTGHIRTRSHRRICHCYCFNMFQYVSCCFLMFFMFFCENKESHQRGSHQLGNKLKQIINHFETLDFIRLNFNDNHVSYLFLGQTWCDICCGPGSHCGPTSTSPSHTFWCNIVLHCLSGQCNKSIRRLTMYWNTLLSSNWLWRTVLVLFKHVLYLFAAIL